MKDTIKYCIIFSLMILFFGFFLFWLMFVGNYLGQKMSCEELDKEGYLVRFDFDWENFHTCKILVNNLDGSKVWRSSYNIGDEHTLENYGVKK